MIWFYYLFYYIDIFISPYKGSAPAPNQHPQAPVIALLTAHERTTTASWGGSKRSCMNLLVMLTRHLPATPIIAPSSGVKFLQTRPRLVSAL